MMSFKHGMRCCFSLTLVLCLIISVWGNVVYSNAVVTCQILRLQNYHKVTGQHLFDAGSWHYYTGRNNKVKGSTYLPLLDEKDTTHPYGTADYGLFDKEELSKLYELDGQLMDVYFVVKLNDLYGSGRDRRVLIPTRFHCFAPHAGWAKTAVGVWFKPVLRYADKFYAGKTKYSPSKWILHSVTCFVCRVNDRNGRRYFIKEAHSRHKFDYYKDIVPIY